MIDKSRLTIQRPEGCPEWAEIGVMVMVRDEDTMPWEGPFPLKGYMGQNAPFSFFLAASGWTYAKQAKPYIKWQPEPGEWVAFWDDCEFTVSVGKYKETSIFSDGLVKHKITDLSFTWDHVARLVDDDGNLIDLRCSVAELKERTVWL